MKVTEKQSRMLWAKACKGQGMSKEQLAKFLQENYGVSDTGELEGGKSLVDGYIATIEAWTPGTQPAKATQPQRVDEREVQTRNSIERQKALAEAVNYAAGEGKTTLEVIEVAKQFLDFITSGVTPFSEIPGDDEVPLPSEEPPSDAWEEPPEKDKTINLEALPEVKTKSKLNKNGKPYTRSYFPFKEYYYSTFDSKIADTMRALCGERVVVTYKESDRPGSRDIIDISVLRDDVPLGDQNEDNLPF